MAQHVRRIRRKRRIRTPGLGEHLTATRLAICTGALILGFAFGLLLLSYGPQAFSEWRESRLLKQASALLAEQKFDNATRAAHEVLRLRHDSLAAYYILAEASEKQNRPETVAWRAQIARLQPQNLDSLLSFASAALRFDQLDTARKALENVVPADRDRASYHVVAGWLARAQGNDAEVEQHFAAAVGKEPANDLYQFNLAVLRIHSPAPEKNSEAREVLERLSEVPGFRAGSLRALLSDAVQRNELERADTLAQNLQMNQQVMFSDYLLCLDFYRKLDEQKFFALLEKVKSVAARNGADLALLMDWLNKNGLSAEVLKWTEKLPTEMTTKPPPCIMIADAFVDAKNWSRLKRWTRTGSWGEADFLRLAYQAHASKQSRQSVADAEFSSLWNSAERAASERPEREAHLARLAMKWNFSTEAEQLWLRVSKHAPLRHEALQSLFGIYRANNDLTNLYHVAQRLYESSPNEPGAAANYARLALLLDQNTAEGHRVAKEAFDRAPSDVNAAMTYAFSLYGLGRTVEGIEIVKTLPPDALHDSHAALYAAVLFLDENRTELAQEYVRQAQAGPIFPEEKKLLDEALAKASATPSLTPNASASPAPSP